MFRALTPVVKYLLIINFGLFLGVPLLQRFFPFDLYQLLSLHYIFSDRFFPSQFVTHMFMHSDFLHIFSNMFGLFIFGPLLEKFWGSKKFLFFYLFTGLGAGLLYSGINFIEVKQLENEAIAYLEVPSPAAFSEFVFDHGLEFKDKHQFIDNYSTDPTHLPYIEESKVIVVSFLEYVKNIRILGASGAIFGILMAFGLLFPNTQLFLLFFPVPIKAKYFVFLYGLYELFALIRNAPGDNVAHFAHLAGMLFAYILVRIWRKQRKTFY